MTDPTKLNGWMIWGYEGDREVLTLVSEGGTTVRIPAEDLLKMLASHGYCCAEVTA